MISYVPKKIHNINIVVWSCCSKRLLSGIHYFVIFICDSASHVILHHIKHQILELLEKTKRRQTYHICQGHFQIKLLI